MLLLLRRVAAACAAACAAAPFAARGNLSRGIGNGGKRDEVEEAEKKDTDPVSKEY